MNPEEQKEVYAYVQAMKLKEGKLAKHARTGTSALTQVYGDSHGDTLTGPKAYVTSVWLEINGRLYEVPVIAQS